MVMGERPFSCLRKWLEWDQSQMLIPACSHSGLVGEGLQFFKCMAENYGIVPEEDHRCCLMDFLGGGRTFRRGGEVGQ